MSCSATQAARTIAGPAGISVVLSPSDFLAGSF
jgi:hypothetical protein